MTAAPFSEADEQSRATRVASLMRDMLIAGSFSPGEKLLEQQLALQFGISRNTLREAFRLLTSQGLLNHIPNRGVFVAAPDEAAVVDIYRVRSVIQKGALQAATRGHPALARMARLVEEGHAAQAVGDWQRVGTVNMEFHRAMVELCDSPRLSASFDLVMAELRLVFGQLADTAYLHDPYVALNAALLAMAEAGNNEQAVQALEAYLLKSERSVLAALQHLRTGGRRTSA